jgi:hypothetical protein
MKNIFRNFVMRKLIICVFLMIAGAVLFAQQPEADNGSSTLRLPDSIRNIIVNMPEDSRCGVGTAKMESDGESILLAEANARLEIARQLTTEIHSIIRIDYNGGPILVEELTEARTKTNVNGATIVRRDKTSDGRWWCVVSLTERHKDIQPKPDTTINIIRSNAAELFDISNIRIDSAIPEWDLTPLDYLPEDMAYGVGAAKLDNDEDSIQLARERARRSLARSLHTEISFVEYFLDVDDTVSNYEYCVSDTSIYDDKPIQTQLLHLAKTEDGTWWVMLGCPVLNVVSDNQ